MKKIFLIFCIVGLFMLAGCAGGGKQLAPDTDEVVGKINSGFETTAVIHYKEIEAQAVMNKQDTGGCSIEFSSPKGLEGMRVEFLQEKVQVAYKGLSFDFNPDSMPGKAVAKMVVSAIDAATKEEGVRVSLENDVLTMTGTIESGEFILKLDPKQGNILKLSIPQSELEIEFLNFKFMS